MVQYVLITEVERMKKIFTIGLAMIIGMSICVSAAGKSVLSIIGATENKDGSVSIDGTIENSAVNQQLTVMAAEYVNENYDMDTISYIDQISYTGTDGKFTVEFNPKTALEKEKIYIVRMGGTDIESAVYMLIKTNDSGEVEWIYGDVDKDGAITASDAALVMQYVLNPESVKEIIGDTKDFLKRADVTENGTLTSEQASYIYQKALNAAFKFPVEE